MPIHFRSLSIGFDPSQGKRARRF